MGRLISGYKVDRRQALAGGLVMAGLAVAGGADHARSAERTSAQLLMFDDPGCPYCRQWHREVGPGYANSPEARRAPLRVVQLREPRPADVTLSSPVRATPTFVLIQDGREVGRIVGYPGQDFFWSMLEGLMKKLKPGERGA